MRIEPPVSVPRASGTMPAASATAEPPLEPPDTRAGPGASAPVEVVVLRRGPPCELVGGRLADDDGACRAGAPHTSASAPGRSQRTWASHRWSRRLRRRSGPRRQRHPFEGPARSRAVRPAGGDRLHAGPVEAERGEGPQARIATIDGDRRSLDRLDRRESHRWRNRPRARPLRDPKGRARPDRTTATAPSPVPFTSPDPFRGRPVRYVRTCEGPHARRLRSPRWSKR